MTKWIAAGALVLGLAGVAAPALAQGIEIGPNGVRVIDPRERETRRDREVETRRGEDADLRRERGISQREAVRIARREGIRDVDSVSERRRVYRIDGADRRGRDITVDVDRMSGDVVSVR